MIDTELARLSNQLMLGTFLLYLIAMIGYAADLAFGQRRAATGEPAEEPVPALVGADAAAAGSDDSATAAGTDTADAGAGAGADDDDEVMVRPRTDWGRFAVLLTVLGWGVNLAAMVTRGVAVDRWPWGNMYEFVAAIVFAAVTTYLVLLWRHPIRFLGTFIMLAVVLALGVDAIVLYTEAGPVKPALNSYWIAIHVTAAIVATGAFTVGAVFTLLYLGRARRERGGRADRGWSARLPESARLDGYAFKVTLFAFPIWTFAIVAGAIWADVAWGRYWGWDNKETWSFITWVGYAAYLHARATAGWKGRRAAVLSLIGFGCLMFNFFGVNALMEGLHSYSGM